MKIARQKIVLLLLFLFSFLIGWRASDTSDSIQNVTQEYSGETHAESSDVAHIPISSPSQVAIPQSFRLTQGTQIFQTFNNCGPASLSMALSHYGTQINQKEIGRALRPYQNAVGDNDDKSVTLSELAVYAEDQGFVTYHRPAGTFTLLQQFVAAGIPVITRTWLNQTDDIGHYRVIIGYDRNKNVLIQDDSLQGAGLAYAENDFLELWQAFNYEFLVLVKPDQQRIAEQILGELVDVQWSWQQALLLADAQLAAEPTDIYAQFNQSVALYHLGKPAEAVQAFEAVKDRLPPRMLWYQIEPILALYKMHNTEEVMRLSMAILENDNKAFSELHYLRGKIHEAEGNRSAADDAFELAGKYNTSTYWKVNVPE